MVRRLTNEEIRAQAVVARRRGALAMKLEPHAASATYDRAARAIVIVLTNGATFTLPLERIPSRVLQDATDAQIAEIDIGPVGDALHWESLDEDLSVMGLARLVFGPRVITRAAASLAGSVTSPAKARAARENGKLGGRPRKKVPAAKSKATAAAGKPAPANRPAKKRSR